MAIYSENCLASEDRRSVFELTGGAGKRILAQYEAGELQAGYTEFFLEEQPDGRFCGEVFWQGCYSVKIEPGYIRIMGADQDSKDVEIVASRCPD
ncbi:hypothetical protein ACFSM5_10045 [Lacibacterium aquatile]|uniref:Uncharacterized protein n=2 Tax=Lacibacterium aquatile TaxID=1168082 RepID=A0ABW5DQ34_9PROT